MFVPSVNACEHGTKFSKSSPPWRKINSVPYKIRDYETAIYVFRFLPRGVQKIVFIEAVSEVKCPFLYGT